MRITLSPVRMDVQLAASLTGDVLTLNGEAFDFSPIPEGAVLDMEAVNSMWIAGPVSRVDGELHLTLRLPYGAVPVDVATFPEVLVVTSDGPIPLPTPPLYVAEVFEA